MALALVWMLGALAATIYLLGLFFKWVKLWMRCVYPVTATVVYYADKDGVEFYTQQEVDCQAAPVMEYEFEDIAYYHNPGVYSGYLPKLGAKFDLLIDPKDPTCVRVLNKPFGSGISVGLLVWTTFMIASEAFEAMEFFKYIIGPWFMIMGFMWFTSGLKMRRQYDQILRLYPTVVEGRLVGYELYDGSITIRRSDISDEEPLTPVYEYEYKGQVCTWSTEFTLGASTKLGTIQMLRLNNEDPPEVTIGRKSAPRTHLLGAVTFALGLVITVIVFGVM